MKLRVLLIMLVLTTVLISGCKPQKVASLMERIVNTWSVTVVREGTNLVYTQGETNNTRPGYSGFTLILNANQTVTFTDFDGVVVTGKWLLQGDDKLVLKDLSPPPTGTNGTVEFSISDFNETTMTLTRTTINAKTGNTKNEYQLKGR